MVGLEAFLEAGHKRILQTCVECSVEVLATDCSVDRHPKDSKSTPGLD